MSIRDSIIARTLVPVEIGLEAKKLIDSYRNNGEVYEMGDYDSFPLNALLRIMCHTKRKAAEIGKKTITSFAAGDLLRGNYLNHCCYMNELQIAEKEFARHLEDGEDLLVQLDEINRKLEDSASVHYSSFIDLMVDLVNSESSLQEIEGIEHTK